MPVHFISRFQPKPGCEAAFREELLRVVVPSRSEPGCISIHVFASLREPREFGIHSEWIDAGAFEVHAGLPHTIHFVAAAQELLTHPIRGLLSEEIVADSSVPLDAS